MTGMLFLHGQQGMYASKILQQYRQTLLMPIKMHDLLSCTILYNDGHKGHDNQSGLIACLRSHVAFLLRYYVDPAKTSEVKVYQTPTVQGRTVAGRSGRLNELANLSKNLTHKTRACQRRRGPLPPKFNLQLFFECDLRSCDLLDFALRRRRVPVRASIPPVRNLFCRHIGGSLDNVHVVSFVGRSGCAFQGRAFVQAHFRYMIMSSRGLVLRLGPIYDEHLQTRPSNALVLSSLAEKCVSVYLAELKLPSRMRCFTNLPSLPAFLLVSLSQTLCWLR